MTPEELPGEALHEERVARFSMLAAENPALAHEEFGVSLIHSIHEAEAAAYLHSLGISAGGEDEDFLLAVAAHRRGALDEAEKSYEAILAKSPKRGEVLYSPSSALGRRDGARERRSLSRLPRKTPHPYRRGLGLARPSARNWASRRKIGMSPLPRTRGWNGPQEVQGQVR